MTTTHRSGASGRRLKNLAGLALSEEATSEKYSALADHSIVFALLRSFLYEGQSEVEPDFRALTIKKHIQFISIQSLKIFVATTK